MCLISPFIRDEVCPSSCLPGSTGPYSAARNSQNGPELKGSDVGPSAKSSYEVQKLAFCSVSLLDHWDGSPFALIHTHEGTCKTENSLQRFLVFLQVCSDDSWQMVCNLYAFHVSSFMEPWRVNLSSLPLTVKKKTALKLSCPCSPHQAKALRWFTPGGWGWEWGYCLKVSSEFQSHCVLPPFLSIIRASWP